MKIRNCMCEHTHMQQGTAETSPSALQLKEEASKHPKPTPYRLLYQMQAMRGPGSLPPVRRSQRLIEAPKGKSKDLLVVVPGGLHSLCDQLLEIQGQQMQITQDPDTYPMLLQFLPDQGGKEAGLGVGREHLLSRREQCLDNIQLPV